MVKQQKELAINNNRMYNSLMLDGIEKRRKEKGKIYD